MEFDSSLQHLINDLLVESKLNNKIKNAISILDADLPFDKIPFNIALFLIITLIYPPLMYLIYYYLYCIIINSVVTVIFEENYILFIKLLINLFRSLSDSIIFFIFLYASNIVE